MGYNSKIVLLMKHQALMFLIKQFISVCFPMLTCAELVDDVSVKGTRETFIPEC